MRYNMKKFIPRILAVVLILTFAAPAYAVGSPPVKEEVVYGLLSQDGSVKDVYIVNSFSKGMITDYGDYSSVENKTNSENLTLKDNLITAVNSADRFYYQGTLKSKELPWTFDIKYELGGNEIPAPELAGKSGQLVISIATVENKAVNSTFFENYMLQLSITLDTEKCSDIYSPGATMANAGKNKVISHMVMPGKTADIYISAAVKDFAMGGIEITGLPLSISIGDLNTSSLTDDMSGLSDAILKLNEGTEKLSEGVDEMHTGAKKLSDGSSSFGYGLSELSGNSKGLLNASALIKSALGAAASAPKGDAVKGFDFGALASLPAGLRQLASGLNEISTGMNALKQGYASAYDALHSSISDIPNTDIDPSPLYAAVYGNKDLTDTLDV
ncbi:MAG: hypothetical protein PHV32_03105, partial [Eubacteriales bacterium]|nr:hypothetical protein [Eubacteriales bacterium]